MVTLFYSANYNISHILRFKNDSSLVRHKYQVILAFCPRFAILHLWILLFRLH